MKLCLAQINTTVGAIDANAALIRRAYAGAAKQRAALVVFPEMTITGYPPEDLLFKTGFIERNLRTVRSLARQLRGPAAVIGFVDRDADGRLYNAAAVIRGGRIETIYRKHELPNYGVFDEKRYFHRGDRPCIFSLAGERIGLTICEDIWEPSSFVRTKAFRDGVSLIINLSASPFHAGKQGERLRLISGLARRLARPVAYINLVGGQDELVFDGGSLVVDAKGRTLAQANRFDEQCLCVDLRAPRASTAKTEGPVEEVYRALVLGTRDYVRKNGFRKALLGLSGGIDSALVARIAVDAIGADNVIALTMPSPYTSTATLADAKELARRLGIACREIAIGPLMRSYDDALKNEFRGMASEKTEENLQARIRGNLLMALSNKFGHLVLTTGNKSELATGYCTLYGDMAGGFAVIKDVPKTLVFKLSRYANSLAPKNSIPVSILRRAPSAELRHGQKDQDSLPPYEQLDRFLARYIERDQQARAGERLLARQVDLNEYKRRQAPPGVKITPKAFGRDRRMPITNGYRA